VKSVHLKSETGQVNVCRGDIPNISEDRYGYVVWIGLKKTTFYSVLEWKYTREYI